MQHSWQAMTESEISNYFAVNPAIGLTDIDVLKRLKRFGNNTDITVLPAVARCMQVQVLRHGHAKTIKLQHLAPGDVVLLGPGERAPADIRLLQVTNLVVDQSALTGESAAIKNTFAAKADADITNQKNMVFSGSFIVSGSGCGIVVTRGLDTAVAKINLKKPAKRVLKNSLLMRRLKRYGIVTQHPKALAQYKDIDFVFVEVTAKDSEIVDVIRKVQLTQRIPCKFLLPLAQAERLAKDLNAAVWDLSAERNTTTTHIWKQIDAAQFIVQYNDAALIKIIATIIAKNHKLLWLTMGESAFSALKIATVSLVIGSKARGDVIAKADLIAPKATLSLLTRILYGRH